MLVLAQLHEEANFLVAVNKENREAGSGHLLNQTLELTALCVALGTPTGASICCSGRRKDGREAGEFGVPGGATRQEHARVGASILGNM